MESMSSLRRQHLLSEFAGLKQACPAGVFVSLTPGDPTLWSAVLFVRNGPYATAVMRFQISFPDIYPTLPPLITFSTDMFHPLITPLTTYMYTTDIQGGGTVSATDEERLPPGGFSLRHGFPDWFGRGKRSAPSSRQVSGQHPSVVATPDRTTRSATNTPETPMTTLPSYLQINKKTISTYEVLKYIKSTFDNEDVLNSLPLAAAGNPGAWHAWRTRQRKLGKLPEDVPADGSGNTDTQATEQSQADSSSAHSSEAAKRPREWNWDGVWEDRVRKGIATSLSEAVLFGSSNSPDELINFLAMEDSEVESVKEKLMRALESSA